MPTETMNPDYADRSTESLGTIIDSLDATEQTRKNVAAYARAYGLMGNRSRNADQRSGLRMKLKTPSDDIKAGAGLRMKLKTSTKATRPSAVAELER